MVVLSILCVILTIGATVAIGDIYKSDAAGRGMAAVFAMGLGSALWILLWIFVAVARVNGAFSAIPGWLLVLLPLALACSSLASIVLITKVGEHSPFLTLLMVLVPVGAVLILVYGLVDILGGIPQQHSASILLIVGVIAVVLSAAPWVAYAPAMAEKNARDEELYAAWQKRLADESNRIEELKAIPEPGTMEQLLAFVEIPAGWSGEIQSAAVARIRKLAHRQEEAERLLRLQDLRVLLVEGDLDLQVTPGLVEATKVCFGGLAQRYKPNGTHPSFEAISDSLQPYFSTLRWLNENGHTPKEEVDMLTAMAKQYPETGSQLLYLAGLDYYRTPPDPAAPKF
jgi:hypothetical protein